MNNLKLNALRIIIFLFAIPVCAQTYSGKVVDNTTGEPLPFVSIGIPGKSVGTVAQLDGSFELTIGAPFINDSLRFSIIGYKAKLIAIDGLPLQSNISLDPNIEELAAIEIVPKKLKEIKLGNSYNSPAIIAGFTTDDLGSELGTVMKIKDGKKYYLKSCGVNFAVVNYDSIIFRINIYDLENGLPGKLIQQLPIYVTVYRNQRSLFVDLKPYSITVDEDFVLSLEWLQDLPEKTKGVAFCAGFFGNKIVYRQVAESDWEDFPVGIGMWCEAEYER